MFKQRTNKATYRVKVGERHYLVTLTHLKNDVNGNGRYEANVIDLDYTETYIATYVYRFGTHYGGDYYEACWIAQKHYERLIENCIE